jgi:hypothetical protein
MTELQARLLPRLVLDTVNCLQLAYDDIDQEYKTRARHAIVALHRADVTDIEAAISMLRKVAHHLRGIERSLEAAHRPFTARKVSRIRERVEHLTFD